MFKLYEFTMMFPEQEYTLLCLVGNFSYSITPRFIDFLWCFTVHKAHETCKNIKKDIYLIK